MQSAELVDVEMNIHSTELRQSGNFEHLGARLRTVSAN